MARWRVTSVIPAVRTQRRGVLVGEAADQRGRRFAQQSLQMGRAEEPPGGRRLRRAHHEDLRGEGRGQVRVAHQGEGLGHRRVRQQDHRLAGHQPAGGVVGIRHQPPHRLGLVRLHQPQQPLLVVGGHLAEQVGRVVVVHRLENVGRPLVRQRAEQADLVVLGQFFEDVGKPLVVERRGDLTRAACRACPAVRPRRRRGACRRAPRAACRCPGSTRTATARRPRPSRPGTARRGGG